MGRERIGTQSRFKKAREFIRGNLYKCSREEMKEYLMEKYLLRSTTIDNIYEEESVRGYMEAKARMRNKARERKEAEDKIAKYKGKKRMFFYFDDRALYKKIEKELIK